MIDKEFIAGIARLDGDWVQWDAWYAESVANGEGDLICELAEALESDDPDIIRALEDDRQVIIGSAAQLVLRELAKRNHESKERSDDPTA